MLSFHLTSLWIKSTNQMKQQELSNVLSKYITTLLHRILGFESMPVDGARLQTSLVLPPTNPQLKKQIPVGHKYRCCQP